MSPNFSYSDLLPLGEDTTKYRLISRDGVSVVKLGDKEFLQVEPSALTLLTETAIHDISHYLRSEHLEQLAKILKDPEATDNDRFVAYTMLLNQMVTAAGELPTCQDTGTAICVAKKGEDVYTGALDAEWISKGVFNTFQTDSNYYSYISLIFYFYLSKFHVFLNLKWQLHIN